MVSVGAVEEAGMNSQGVSLASKKSPTVGVI
jgi:hypothetical protein